MVHLTCSRIHVIKCKYTQYTKKQYAHNYFTGTEAYHTFAKVPVNQSWTIWVNCLHEPKQELRALPQQNKAIQKSWAYSIEYAACWFLLNSLAKMKAATPKNQCKKYHSFLRGLFASGRMSARNGCVKVIEILNIFVLLVTSTDVTFVLFLSVCILTA